MRPGNLCGVDYWFGGHEQEGFYDILTGRPRYSIPKYNLIRARRTEERKKRLSKKLDNQPGKVKSYVPIPEGLPYNVPHLKQVLETPKRQKRYSRYYWPAIV